MLLRHEETAESRYDRETLAKVTALAQRLQSRHQETLTASEMVAIGSEVGLAPEFVNQALGQLTQAPPVQTKAVAPTRTASPGRLKAFSKAWFASAWTLPFFLMFITSDFHRDGPGAPSVGLFFLGWALYFGLGVFLKHAPESEPPVPIAGPLPRLAILEMVFALQRELEGRKRFSAFLSVDVVGSTEMKRNGPELEAEYSFGQFSAWVNEVVRSCNGAVHSAAGDGIMCRFPAEVNAVRAARRLQEGLAAFNAERNRLPMPFRLRCGISAGDVPFESGLSAGYIHSPVIDRAAALQKQAEPGDILVSQEAAAAALGELGALAKLPGTEAEPAFSWRAGGR